VYASTWRHVFVINKHRVLQDKPSLIPNV